MRYFFFFPSPEPSLAGRVVVPAPGCPAVASAGSAQALPAGECGALTGAVGVPPIAVTADDDLTMAAGTEVVAGTGQHRHAKADEGWICTCSSATLNRLCASTVRGMASVLTAKSWPTLCLSHQPFPHSAITPACHLFLHQHNATTVPRIGDPEPAKIKWQ